MAKEIFEYYGIFCEEAQTDFYQRHWPCEKKDKQGSRCVNVASGHTKGHQKHTGRVFAAGEFQSSFNLNPESERENFLSSVLSELDKLIQKLRQMQDVDERPADEEQAAAEIHMLHTLAPSAEIWRSELNGTRPAMSHTTCFCCLASSPEHTLYCGHIICRRCLENYSTLSDDGFYRCLNVCPLCNKQIYEWKIKAEQPTAGLRVLSLDGLVQSPFIANGGAVDNSNRYHDV